MSNGCFGAPKGGAHCKGVSQIWVVVPCAHDWHVRKEVTGLVQHSSNIVYVVLDLFLTIIYTDLLLHTVKLPIPSSYAFSFTSVKFKLLCRGMRLPPDLMFLLVRP